MVKPQPDELVLFLTPVSDQVVEALADRYCVLVAIDETPSTTIERCGYRRAHLISRGTAALDFFVRRSDLVQSLVIIDAAPEEPADYRAVLELIDVPLLLLNANPFLTAIHNAVPMSQLRTIDLDDPQALGRALWSHLQRAQAIEPQKLALTSGCITEPSADSVERAARVIAAAHRPLIITGELGRHRNGPEALVQLAQRHGIAVVEHSERAFFNFPTHHPLHLGFNSSAFVKYADVIVVIECEEPWHPEFTNLSHDPKIIRFGEHLGGHPALAVRRLTSTLDKMRPDRERIKGRLAAYASEHRRVLQQAQTRAIAEAARPKITLQFASYCLGEAIDDRVTIWNDSDLDPQLVPRRLADSWFATGSVFSAALDAQAADRDQTMVVVMSDASYIASEPLAAHGRKLPVVVIVLNQEPSLRADAVAAACGVKSMRVESPRDLAASMRDALQIARGEKRQVLLNVVME